MAKGAWKDEVHIFGYGRRQILYQVHTGTFFEIDALVQDILSRAEKTDKEELIAGLLSRYGRKAIVQTLGELENCGVLSFGSLPPPEEDLDASYRGSSAPLPITITLHISHTCNLRCAYCFASGGTYGKKAAMMELPVARQAVDWLLQESAGAGKCHVDFFGGEPLLNFGLIRDAIRYARIEAEKRGVEISFGLTTNGTILTPQLLDFIVREEIGVVFSIDGDARTHNRMRTRPDGSGTYAVVAENIRQLAFRRPDLVILRATMTACNLDIAGIEGHLTGFGPSSVDIAPAAVDPGTPLAIRPEHLPELKRHIRRLSEQEFEAIARGECLPRTRFRKAIQRLLDRRRKEYGCGGGKTFFAVSVDGAIYFCSSLVGRPEFRMGDIFNGIVPDKKRQFDRISYVDERHSCKTCWARYLCGGGCVHDAQMACGTPERPNPVSCETTRYTYELAMGMCLELRAQHAAAYESLLDAAD